MPGGSVWVRLAGSYYSTSSQQSCLTGSGFVCRGLRALSLGLSLTSALTQKWSRGMAVRVGDGLVPGDRRCCDHGVPRTIPGQDDTVLKRRAVCSRVPGPLSCCAVAFAADRRLPALDADLPERCDHVVCCSLVDLNERGAIGGLDRADLPARQVRLPGDDADEILRPDSGRTASPHEQPRGARARPPG